MSEHIDTLYAPELHCITPLIKIDICKQYIKPYLLHTQCDLTIYIEVGNIQITLILRTYIRISHLLDEKFWRMIN